MWITIFTGVCVLYLKRSRVILVALYNGEPPNHYQEKIQTLKTQKL